VGPSLLGQVTFPITDKIQRPCSIDYRGRRGPAIGFESEVDYGKDDSSYAKITTYFIQDQNPRFIAPASHAVPFDKPLPRDR